MALLPDELMQAFAATAGDNGDDLAAESSPADVAQHPAVSFGMRCRRGPGGGYVRVWGPNADPRSVSQSHVIIEMYNGMVGVRAPLHQHIGGAVERVSSATIKSDPLGYGCGSNYGPFTHAIPSIAMGPGALYPDAAAVVAAVLAAFRKLGWRW